MSSLAIRFDRSMWGSKLAAVCAGLAVAGATGTARGQCLEAHLNGEAGGSFGWSVAISADTAIVGAAQEDSPTGGAAYVFVRSGDVWTQQARLLASVGGGSVSFGRSVAIAGDTAVVCAEDRSAYVFVRNGGAWTEQARLVPSVGGYSEFGRSVAISGNTILVGAPEDSTPAGYHAGSAYFFVNGGGVWTEQAHVFASDGAIWHQFGLSVAIDGDTAVVGARGVDIAYVFTRSGDVWTEQARLIPSDDFGFQFFGASVAINGDTVVVGAADDNTPDGGGGAGSAYVFVRSGDVWTEQAHVFAADGAAYDRFGFSCSVSGDMAIVGAFQDDRAGVTGTGSAYVFVRSGSDWTQQAHLFAPDSTQYDQFGFKVGISGNTALVSAWQDDLPNGGGVGSAYVFDLSCCSGDLDGDGAVDLSDLATLLSHFAVASGATRADGDFDADGDVDLVDLAHLLAVLGTTC